MCACVRACVCVEAAEHSPTRTKLEEPEEPKENEPEKPETFVAPVRRRLTRFASSLLAHYLLSYYGPSLS